MAHLLTNTYVGGMVGLCLQRLCGISEETLRGPTPLLSEGLFWDLEPGARQTCPPALQLMQHQPVFLQEKQLPLFFILSVTAAEALPVPFVKAVG